MSGRRRQSIYLYLKADFGRAAGVVGPGVATVYNCCSSGETTSMRQMRWFGPMLLGSIALFSAAASAAKPSSPIPVTTLVEDVQGALTFQLQSDQAGTYVNGASSVTSIITTAPGDTHAAGDYYMATGSQKRNPRQIYLNFSQPTPTGGNLSGGQPNIFKAGLFPDGILKVNCDLDGVDLRTLPAQTNGVPTVVTCPLAISFNAGGGAYTLHMNPGITPAGSVLFPETDYVKITCMAGGSGVCTEFRLDPNGTYNVNGNAVAANVARLVPGEDTVPTTSLGDYYFSFEIVVMR
jgi:hypothetical protein